MREWARKPTRKYFIVLSVRTIFNLVDKFTLLLPTLCSQTESVSYELYAPIMWYMVLAPTRKRKYLKLVFLAMFLIERSCTRWGWGRWGHLERYQVLTHRLIKWPTTTKALFPFHVLRFAWPNNLLLHSPFHLKRNQHAPVPASQVGCSRYHKVNSTFFPFSSLHRWRKHTDEIIINIF